MAIPVRQIPATLLADAHGIAIIPDVLKIGFIAGVRRGHGVVMVRDPNGAWGLPQFITLTGGSVGWQAGVQGTDVVLVFMTEASVQGLLRGKFTIGADVAAAAGPVGRNAAAATDVRLKAEILSYSRSRGLFAGLSLDGSAIELDPVAQTTYYGAGPGQPPVQIPESANKLVTDVTQLTAAAGARRSARRGRAASGRARRREQTRSAGQSATELQAMVDDGWRKYLALPREVFENDAVPRVDTLQAALTQYDRVAQDPKYQALATRREFRTTYQLLRDYTRELSTSSDRLTLPPPPQR